MRIATKPVVSETTSSRRIPVLLIDDDPMTIELITEILASGTIDIYSATDRLSALDMVRRVKPHIIILDLVMPGVVGMEMLEKILEIDSGIDVILLTGQYSTDSAVEAIQHGACDYLIKPISPERLSQRVQRCLADAQTQNRSLQLDREQLDLSQFEGIVGRSPVMLELFLRMKRVAPHFQTILVTGETGTGKELVAKALHNLSPVASRPYLVCNCAALVETLFESELFGYMKGAFTGAAHDKLGLVEHAQGGTLFLDEIGEMPLTTQAKLLRLIQNREVQRLGAPAARKVDVRIIAATHQDLARMVAEKRFREDLYYRLTSIQLKLPSLLQRREDLPVLQRHFLTMYSERYQKRDLHLSRRAQAILADHTWPGNVREFENALSHGCMMAEGNTIEVRHLPDSVKCSPRFTEVGAPLSLKEMQAQHILKVLELTGGNILHSAKILGISRATLYRMLSPQTASHSPTSS